MPIRVILRCATPVGFVRVLLGLAGCAAQAHAGAAPVGPAWREDLARRDIPTPRRDIPEHRDVLWRHSVREALCRST